MSHCVASTESLSQSSSPQSRSSSGKAGYRAGGSNLSLSLSCPESSTDAIGGKDYVLHLVTFFLTHVFTKLAPGSKVKRRVNMSARFTDDFYCARNMSANLEKSFAHIFDILFLHPRTQKI